MTINRIKRYLYPLILLSFSLNACGGSGSSGFESRTAAEQNAIAKATEDGGCAMLENSLICAPGAEAIATEDVAGQSANPPLLSNPMSLSIEPVSGALVSCEQDTGNKTCRVKVEMTPFNFLPETRLFVASKREDHVFWTAPLEAVASSEPFKLEAFIHFDLFNIQAQKTFQIAVLIYPPHSNLPIEIEQPLLSHFRAQVIYVVTRLNLEIVAIP